MRSYSLGFYGIDKENYPKVIYPCYPLYEAVQNNQGCTLIIMHFGAHAQMYCVTIPVICI